MRAACLPGLVASVTLILSPHITSLAHAIGRDRRSGTTSDEWDRGTFQNPSINARPKFRYWAPDAFIDDGRVDFDIEQFKSMHLLSPVFLFLGPNSSETRDWYGRV